MATNYSGYNQSQYDNQSKYLNNLINSGNAGQAAWAKNELASLNSQYSGGSSGSSGSSSSSSSKPSSSSSGGSSSSSNKGSSSSGASSSSGSGTNYSGYTQAQYNNQSAYLQGLINQGGGNAAWAQQELNKLNSQYQPAKPTIPSASTTGSGTNYGDYTEQQYNNQKTYLENLIAQGGGTANWAQNELNNLNSQYGDSIPTSQPTQPTTPAQPPKPQWDVTGWDTFTGADGIQYSISPLNGTIIALQNGTQTRYLPTDANYNNQYAAMQQQIGNAYTPYYNWTDANGNNITTKNYLLGNSDLQYALEQAMKANGSNTYDIDGYVRDLYSNVGQQRNDGTVITLADVNAELNRLGLSDYNSDNVIYTAGGDLIPNNQFVTNKTGSFGGSNSEDSTWVSYGGQDYLVGGDSANYVDYVNGKTGNTNSLDYIFDDMANNPYAMQDPEFLAGYNQQLNNFNNSAGIQNSTTQNTVTGNQNVDDVINYVNSLNGYLGATGGSYGGNTGGTGVNLLDMLQNYLNGGLEANQNFINQQRAYAEQQAQQQASDAYVNKVLAGDALKQQLSALGLGTSGAVQSAQMGVQGQYGDNLAQINSNLAQMLNGLSEQELQVLSDYYNNMANYAYKVTNDEADRAYRNAQLALQQQQMAYDEAYRQQQLALQKQQYDWENKFAQQKYNDSQNANKQTGGNAYAPNKLGSVTYEDNNNLNLDIINPNNPQAGGEVTPQVNPEVQANWQGSMDNLMNVDLPTALNLISGIGSASQVQVPQAMDVNQLAQLGMGAYNNATANVSAPASSYVNQTELQKKINEALALINNGGYSY